MINSLVESICFVSLRECKAATNSVPDYSTLSEWQKSLELLHRVLNYWKEIQSNYVKI